MMLELWFMLPVSIAVASIATGSGFGGGILLFPVFIYVLNLNVPEAVGTGMITELCGMTSAMITYNKQKKIEYEIALPMIIISFPGLLTGLYIIQIVNPAIPKFFFGFLVIICAFWMLFSLKSQAVNTNSHVLVEKMIPYAWVPFIGGLSSGISSVGTAESLLPVLERKLKIEIHRAIATAVMVEGAVGWLATSINIWEGNIRWDIAAFTTTGVIIGGRIGPVLSGMLDVQILKLIFSVFVFFTGIHMIYKNYNLLF